MLKNSVIGAVAGARLPSRARGQVSSLARHTPTSKAGGLRGVVRLQCRIADMPDTTMRAAFYEGARKFSTGWIAMPTRGPDEALLRVRRVGICGTDLHIFQGHLDHRVPKRGIIGHEIFA